MKMGASSKKVLEKLEIPIQIISYIKSNKRLSIALLDYTFLGHYPLSTRIGDLLDDIHESIIETEVSRENVFFIDANTKDIIDESLKLKNLDIKYKKKEKKDELPELINLLKGDVRLFGVRPLSLDYYSRYPIELQKTRIKYKPGLIPPYYADMPKSFDEIIESERRYLQQKTCQPFYTDIKYFTKAMYNIVLKKARSK